MNWKTFPGTMSNRLLPIPKYRRQLHSQVGFYLLPPNQEIATTTSKRNKRYRRHHRSNLNRSKNNTPRAQNKAWGSSDQLGAILEASEESAISSSGPSRDGNSLINGLNSHWKSISYDDLKAIGVSFWNSGATSSQLIRSQTSKPGLFMQEKPFKTMSKSNLINNMGYPSNHYSDGGMHARRDSVSTSAASASVAPYGATERRRNFFGGRGLPATAHRDSIVGP